MPQPLSRYCLVTVGATARFTQLLTEILDAGFLARLADDGFTHLVLQCGRDYEHFSRNVLPAVAPRWPAIEITAFDFVDDLSVQMTQCRAAPTARRTGVVICHAGTGTILDGMRINVPLIVVPNPTLKDNHQVELAEEIQRQGYGIWGRLGDVSYALEQLPLQLDKTERQFRPHAAGEPDVDLWRVTGAMLARYDAEHPPPAQRKTRPGREEVRREEAAQMTMG